MKDNKENNQDINIETNNNTVLYSIMISLLKKRAKKEGGNTYQYSFRVCEKTKTLDLFVVDFHGTDTILIEEYKID